MKIEIVERIKKWEDKRDLRFSYFCLVGRMEGGEIENLFIWLIRKMKLIWSIYFGNSQFSPRYFQLIVNLVPTIKSLMKNAYVANISHCCHTC